jgi:hypothetical protein
MSCTDGTSAYLEATSCHNRHLCLRHGYLPRPAHRIHPHGLQLYPMWRPAAPHLQGFGS